MVSTRKGRSPRGNPAPPSATSKDPIDRPGTGALCPDAQADGVPCFELGRDCEQCEQATLRRDDRGRARS